MPEPLDVAAVRALAATRPSTLDRYRIRNEALAGHVPALLDTLEAAQAEVERLRAQNKTAADERDQRYREGERRLARLQGLMREAWEHHARFAADPEVGYSQYGLAGAAVLIEENERLRAETVPRSALVQVGVDWCSVHDGVRNEDEAACDLCAVDDRECRLVPVYVIRSTQEGDGDGRVGDEIGAT